MSDLEERIEKYKDILDIEENNTEFTKPEEVIRDSKKFQQLCEVFEVDSGNMEDNLLKHKQEIIESKESIKTKEMQDLVSESIIDSEELLDDFRMIREALREDIKTTKIILNSLGQDISSTHSDDLSGSIVMAYAELKKGNVQSIKTLMDSYSSVGETQLKIKKLVSEIKNLEETSQSSETNNTINFIGTPLELLEKLKKD